MGMEVGYGAAFLAGLASFLSPCILPIVPFYLCYMAGLSFNALTGEEDIDPAAKRRVVVSSFAFAAGVIVIFVGLGATATAFGQVVRDWWDVLRWAAAILIGVLGLHFVGLLRIPLFYREARFDVGENRWGVFGAFLIGMAFAFGWTPCVGPVLAAILFTASGAESASQGASLLLLYGLGMTLPFILAAFFTGPFLKWAKGFRRYLPVVEKVMGGALIVFAILIATDTMNYIGFWMLEAAPDLWQLQ